MSSLAAGSRPDGGWLGAAGTAARRGLGAHPDAIATVAVAALLLAVTFVARGGSALARTTTVTIALTLLGGATVVVALLAAPTPRRLWGGTTLLLFSGLAILTGLSIAWSILPSASWQAANLTFSYLALFAGTMALVKLAPARWPAAIGGVVLAAVVVSGYALLAEVFPSISPLDLYARLRTPFDYWNAVGLMAALGIPGCLWLGARRDGHAALGALAVPALGLLLVALMLSYGRGPLLAALVAVACWFALVPLRLRGVAVLATAGAGAAIVCAWAFSNEALSTDGTPLDVRADAGHALGGLLVALLVVLLLAGLGLAFAMSRSSLSPNGRRTVGALVLAVLALVPLAGVAKLATSDRGLTGSISHGWEQLTDPDARQPPNDPSRLASVGGVRARYWDDGFTIWRASPWTGVGADGYATGRRPIQRDHARVRHAHGWVPQTLADLGIAGMGVSAALMIAWLVAAGRAIGLRRPGRPRAPMTPERIGLATLATTAIAFGVHSTVDWTWFIPGTAVTGLLCAAWVAARGPDDASAGRAAWRLCRPRIALAVAAAAVALGGAWTIWQPQRAVSADEAALTALDGGDLETARAEAERAGRIDPLSLDPQLTLATVQTAAREPAAARATLERAVRSQPSNPEAWLRLGELLRAQGDARAALPVLNAAIYLDPRSPAPQTEYARAKAAAGSD